MWRSAILCHYLCAVYLSQPRVRSVVILASGFRVVLFLPVQCMNVKTTSRTLFERSRALWWWWCWLDSDGCFVSRGCGRFGGQDLARGGEWSVRPVCLHAGRWGWGLEVGTEAARTVILGQSRSIKLCLCPESSIRNDVQMLQKAGLDVK